MYGIKFSNEGEKTVEFGLRKAQPVETLGEAYDLVNADLRAQGADLPAGNRDERWDTLTLRGDTLFEVTISAYRGDWLVLVKDFYSGSGTSTGALNLAEVFAFIVYWHEGAFEPIG